MGISSQIAVALLREHRHKPIAGRYLTIGRQTINLTPAQALRLVERELGFSPSAREDELEIDTATRAAVNGPFITDRAFLSLFSDATYQALDVTDYEGADIVADLSGVLPAGLENAFDFVLDGSCLDNIFDPAAAIRNIARLQARGGRAFLLNRSSRVHHAYVAFALAWFHDFFAVNEFADCQVYLAQWDGPLAAARLDLYHYQPISGSEDAPSYFGQDRYFLWTRDSLAVVVCEKGPDSTVDRTPVQYQYRPNTPWLQEGVNSECGYLAGPEAARDVYFKSALRFRKSSRPPLVTDADKVDLPDKYFHYAEQIGYRGSIWPVI